MLSDIHDEEIKFTTIIVFLLQSRKIIGLITGVVILISLIFILSLPRQYSVVTEAVNTNQPQNNDNLMGMAALAGVPISNNTSELNLLKFVNSVILNANFLDPILYSDSLHSVERKWPVEIGKKAKDSLVLSEYFKIEVDTSLSNWRDVFRRKLYNKFRKKSKVLSVSFSEDNVLKVKTNFSDPLLSYTFHMAYIKQLGKFIEDDFVTRDTKNRVFIEERLAEVKKDLEASEKKLLQYNKVHRTINMPPEQQTTIIAPEVYLENSRRKRVVEQNAQMYKRLLQEYELAKIEEKKYEPAFEIIRYPEIPLKPSAPNRKLLLVVSAILGLFLGVLYVFGKEWIKSISEEIKK